MLNYATRHGSRMDICSDNIANGVSVLEQPAVGEIHTLFGDDIATGCRYWTARHFFSSRL